MTTQNNEKPKSPWTNAIGIVMVLFALVIYGAQFFFELKTDINDKHLGAIMLVGLIVWLGFSDQFFKALIKWFQKKK